MLVPLLFVCLSPVLSYATDLPIGIKTCKTDSTFNDCVLKQSKDVMAHMAKGDPKLGVPPIDPLFIPKIQMTDSGKKSISLNLTMENVNIYGFSKSEIIDLELSKKDFKLSFKVPKLKIDGDYSVNGKMLVVPMTGNGKMKILIDDMVVETTLMFEIEKRDGTEYYKVNPKPQLSYTTKKVTFDLENLYNGNKALGDATNKMLNENWEEVTNLLGPAVRDAIGNLYGMFMSDFARRTPSKDLLPPP